MSYCYPRHGWIGKQLYWSKEATHKKSLFCRLNLYKVQEQGKQIYSDWCQTLIIWGRRACDVYGLERAMREHPGDGNSLYLDLNDSNTHTHQALHLRSVRLSLWYYASMFKKERYLQWKINFLQHCESFTSLSVNIYRW